MGNTDGGGPPIFWGRNRFGGLHRWTLLAKSMRCLEQFDGEHYQSFDGVQSQSADAWHRPNNIAFSTDKKQAQKFPSAHQDRRRRGNTARHAPERTLFGHYFKQAEPVSFDRARTEVPDTYGICRAKKQAMEMTEHGKHGKP